MRSLQKRLGRIRSPRGIRLLARDIALPMWDKPERELAETLLTCLLSYMHDFERRDGDWIRLIELTASAESDNGQSLGATMRAVGKHCRSSMAYAYWLAYSLADPPDRRRAAFELMRTLLQRCEKCCRLFELEEVTLADLWARGFAGAEPGEPHSGM